MSEQTKTGEIIAIDDLITFDSGFTKREFIIKTTDDGDYPQDIKFELVKDKTEHIEKFNKGDEIAVHYNIRGNEYKGKYYVNLVAWRLEGVNVQSVSQTGLSKQAQERQAAGAVSSAPVEPSGDMDDIPF